METIWKIIEAPIQFAQTACGTSILSWFIPFMIVFIPVGYWVGKKLEKYQERKEAIEREELRKRNEEWEKRND